MDHNEFRQHQFENARKSFAEKIEKYRKLGLLFAQYSDLMEHERFGINFYVCPSVVNLATAADIINGFCKPYAVIDDIKIYTGNEFKIAEYEEGHIFPKDPTEESHQEDLCTPLWNWENILGQANCHPNIIEQARAYITRREEDYADFQRRKREAEGEETTDEGAE